MCRRGGGRQLYVGYKINTRSALLLLLLLLLLLRLRLPLLSPSAWAPPATRFGFVAFFAFFVAARFKFFSAAQTKFVCICNAELNYCFLYHFLHSLPLARLPCFLCYAYWLFLSLSLPLPFWLTLSTAVAVFVALLSVDVAAVAIVVPAHRSNIIAGFGCPALLLLLLLLFCGALCTAVFGAYWLVATAA